ncbi:MAG: hypothetical protein ACJA1R_003236, partial [Flavobacteriales bacterium]
LHHETRISKNAEQKQHAVQDHQWCNESDEPSPLCSPRLHCC